MTLFHSTMKHSGPKTRVSKHYGLGRDQNTLDFVDIPIGNDIPVFIDPSRLRSLNSVWGSECTSLLQHFFNQLLIHIRTNDQATGLLMLEGLSERNEFHLGLSRSISRGNGVGPGFALAFWNALSKSKAGKTGFLKDLEDACLFIEGIGPDRISDAVCNIIRGPLIKYTQQICQYYGIPLIPGAPSGQIWNPLACVWEDSFTNLPSTDYGTLILVPKVIVRQKFFYDSTRYYTHYLLPLMQKHENSINSSLVQILNNGSRRVTKKALREKYGADKLTIERETIKHPQGLDQFKKDAIRTSRPMSHFQFAEIGNSPTPKFDQLISDLKNIPPGKAHASRYEVAVEKLLSVLLYPSLTSPTKQHEIHQGRKRIDITYVNSAYDGFFKWLSLHYSSAHIFVECKNYGQEVENPEIDQLAGRFSPSRGQVGLLICRSLKNGPLLERRCIDTAHDNRGYIIHLTDEDLITLINEYKNSDGGSDYPYLIDPKSNHLNK